MSELIPLSGGLAGRQARAASREMARIDHAANLQAERVSAVSYVAKRAMHEVTMVSALEAQLGTMVPAAAQRLRGIADLGALAMAEVVAETIRKVK